MAQPVADRADRREETAAALNAFFGIAEKWGLSTEEQMALLGGLPRSTFFKWKKEGGLVPPDTEERLSYLLGIYKALHILFPDAALADAWIRKPNRAPLFGGQSALDLMLREGLVGMYKTRRYLDAQRGGWA